MKLGEADAGQVSLSLKRQKTSQGFKTGSSLPRCVEQKSHKTWSAKCKKEGER